MVFEAQYVFASFKTAITYLPITIELSTIPLIVGIIFGTLIAICRNLHIIFIGKVFDILIPVLRGIPLVLYLLIINFMVLKPLDILAKTYPWLDVLRLMDKSYIAIIAISVYAVAVISETMRSALFSVDAGQYEAGYSIGLTRGQVLRRIVLPQAIPFAVPNLCNNFIGLIKGSAIVYLITVIDVLNGAMSSAQINYRFLEAYIAASIIYWGLCFFVERVSVQLEKHLNKYQYDN